MVTCGFLIYQLHQKFTNNPITMTMDGKEAQVQEIPFPAITFFGEFEFSDKYARRLYGLAIFRRDDAIAKFLRENGFLLE